MLDQMSDPDYYYHVALSKQILAGGIPETVPQVKDIGWDVLFTDKEFLFHVFTTWFYWMFGEVGLRILPLVFFGISLCTLLYQSLKNLGVKLFLLPLTMILLDPHFMRRMIMVRPQTLAVMLFVFILVGFATKRKYVVLISSLLFALSYHGLQIPGILIAASVFTSLVAQPGHIKYAGYCALGLIAGCLLNPYFPGNLTFLSQIVNIVRDTTESVTLPYGSEIYPWKTSEFLYYSFLTFAVLALALGGVGVLHGAHRDNEKEDFANTMFMTVAFALFLAVAMMTPRGREYLIPTGVLLMIQVLRQTPVASATVVTVMAAAQLFVIHGNYGILTGIAPEKNVGLKHVFAAIDKIPTDEKAHVLNCNWSHGPFIFYRRPNVTFSDILDPSFLHLSNPSLSNARLDMVHGRVADLRFVVNDVFKAQYMLCDFGELNLAFDADPSFKRVYPEVPVAKSTAPVALFQLKEPQVLANYQREFEYSLPMARDQWTPITAEFKTASGSIPTSTLNFRHLLPKETLIETTKDNDERVANCIFLRPKNLSAHAGAEYVGIGGGPNVRLWVNDEPLYENTGEPDRQKSTDLLIPLPKPLKADDNVLVMACPGVVQSYFAVTLSFWTGAQMDSICSHKTLPPPAEGETPTEWRFKGLQEKNCLAPIASRAKPVVAAAPPSKTKKK